MHTALSRWTALGVLAVLSWWVPTAPASSVAPEPDIAREQQVIRPRVVLVMAAHVAPEQVAGLDPQELLRIDSADPGRAQAVDAAVRELGVSAVLIVADEAERREAQVDWLMERSPALRHGCAMDRVALHLVRHDESTGRLQWQGGEPVNWALLGVGQAPEDDPLAVMLAAASTGQHQAPAPALQNGTIEPVRPNMPVSATVIVPAESGFPWVPILGVAAAGGIIWYSRGCKVPATLQPRRLLAGGLTLTSSETAPAEPLVSEVERQNPRLHDALSRLRQGLRSTDLI